ncbi:nucleolar protein 12 [Microdochium nivale]|nr:nucleolar protein 12 [Microdochium nivale]
MGKSSRNALGASSKAIDPTLDALFSQSAGPSEKPAASRYTTLLPPKERKPTKASIPEEPQSEFEEEGDDEELSEIDGDIEDVDLNELGSDESVDESEEEGAEEEESEAESSTEEKAVPTKQERKRKRKDEHDDLESKYLRKLEGEVEGGDDDDDDAAGKRRKKLGSSADDTEGITGEDSATKKATEGSGENSFPILHESLLPKEEQEHGDIELDKANRTLFLGNVSADAISSSTAKKELMTYLASPLADLDAATGPHKIESLRFRSVAFATGAMPKRAAYITKSLMSATTKSANAYVVYSTPLAARAAHKALNGTVVLGRHMRVDSVAHPAPINHRRCVFVGNLGFVDDETVINTNADGETTTKKRNKTPSDIEEGLWRIFGQHAGKVESVRVPRDPHTRVGKGFAYVQFADGNHVEAALLLNEKKFPPMLPRALRVSRAKNPRNTALAVERTVKAKLSGGGEPVPKAGSTKYQHKATPEQQSQAGRAGRLLGRAGAAKAAAELKGKKLKTKPPRHESRAASASAGAGFVKTDGLIRPIKTPEQIVFEGRRASSKDGKPRDLKLGKAGKKKSGGNPGKKTGGSGGVSKPKAATKGHGAKRASEWRQRLTKK